MKKKKPEKNQISQQKRRSKRWRKIVTTMACLVVFVTTYILILPAITLERDVHCGEHHTHTLACYSDPNADLEMTTDWEKSLPAEESLQGESNEKIIQSIARSQLGYAESLHNYKVVDEETETISGLTRYGQWFIDHEPSAAAQELLDEYDDWSAMFASFVLYYAGVSETDMPLYGSTSQWMSALEEESSLMPEDYSPKIGDVIFTQEGMNKLLTGIVVDVQDNEVTAVLGDVSSEKHENEEVSDKVQEKSFEIGSEHIKGYAALPQEITLSLPERTTVPNAEEENAAEEKTLEEPEDASDVQEDADLEADEALDADTEPNLDADADTDADVNEDADEDEDAESLEDLGISLFSDDPTPDPFEFMNGMMINGEYHSFTYTSDDKYRQDAGQKVPNATADDYRNEIIGEGRDVEFEMIDNAYVVHDQTDKEGKNPGDVVVYCLNDSFLYPIGYKDIGDGKYEDASTWFKTVCAQYPEAKLDLRLQKLLYAGYPTDGVGIIKQHEADGITKPEYESCLSIPVEFFQKQILVKKPKMDGVWQAGIKRPSDREFSTEFEDTETVSTYLDNLRVYVRYTNTSSGGQVQRHRLAKEYCADWFRSKVPAIQGNKGQGILRDEEIGEIIKFYNEGNSITFTIEEYCSDSKVEAFVSAIGTFDSKTDAPFTDEMMQDFKDILSENDFYNAAYVLNNYGETGKPQFTFEMVRQYYVPDPYAATQKAVWTLMNTYVDKNDNDTLIVRANHKNSPSKLLDEEAPSGKHSLAYDLYTYAMNGDIPDDYITAPSKEAMKDTTEIYGKKITEYLTEEDGMEEGMWAFGPIKAADQNAGHKMFYTYTATDMSADPDSDSGFSSTYVLSTDPQGKNLLPYHFVGIEGDLRTEYYPQFVIEEGQEFYVVSAYPEADLPAVYDDDWNPRFGITLEGSIPYLVSEELFIYQPSDTDALGGVARDKPFQRMGGLLSYNLPVSVFIDIPEPVEKSTEPYEITVTKQLKTSSNVYSTFDFAIWKEEDIDKNTGLPKKHAVSGKWFDPVDKAMVQWSKGDTETSKTTVFQTGLERDAVYYIYELDINGDPIPNEANRVIGDSSREDGVRYSFVVNYSGNGSVKDEENAAFTITNDHSRTRGQVKVKKIFKDVAGNQLSKGIAGTYRFGVWDNEHHHGEPLETVELTWDTTDTAAEKTATFKTDFDVNKNYYVFEMDGDTPLLHGKTFVLNGQNFAATYPDGSSIVQPSAEGSIFVVANQATIQLPQTGGSGTIMFTLGGLILILGSLLYGLRLKRKM